MTTSCNLTHDAHNLPAPSEGSSRGVAPALVVQSLGAAIRKKLSHLPASEQYSRGGAPALAVQSLGTVTPKNISRASPSCPSPEDSSRRGGPELAVQSLGQAALNNWIGHQPVPFSIQIQNEVKSLSFRIIYRVCALSKNCLHLDLSPEFSAATDK